VKLPIKHGGCVRCEMVTVVETKNDIVFKKACGESFVTYSVSRLVRAQAANAGWTRPKVKLVKWPGNPPAGDNKKVDLCPKHGALVMTLEEYKAHKLELKEKRRAETKPKPKPKSDKPARPRKKKEAPASP